MQLKFQATHGCAGETFAQSYATGFGAASGHALPEVLPRFHSSLPVPNPPVLNVLRHSPETGIPALFSQRLFNQRQRGFTLVELLVVIMLVAILAVGAMMSTDGVEDDAKVKLTLVEMSELRKALLQFKRDVGHLPDALEDPEKHTPDLKLNLLFDCENTNPAAPNYDEGCILEFNIFKARGWNGPYALAERQEGPVSKVMVSGYFDGWGNRYCLFDEEDTAPGKGIARIVSFGPDGRDGLGAGKENADATDCLPVTDGNVPPVMSDDIVLCLVQ